MGQHQSNITVGVYQEGGIRHVGIQCGITSPPTGGEKHRSYSFGLLSDAAAVGALKVACKDADAARLSGPSAMLAAFRAAVTVACTAWMDAEVPASWHEKVALEAADQHAATYAW